MKFSLHELPEAIIILDTDNKIIGVNQAGEQLLKKKRTDLIGQLVDSVFPRQASAAKGTKILIDDYKEASLSRGSEQTFFVELIISTVDDPDGEHVGRVMLIRDTFQSKQEKALRTQNLMLQALEETTFELHSSLELDVVLHNIVERACRLFGTSHGYLNILDETTDQLKPVVGTGALEEVLGYYVARGEGIAGTVWVTEKYIVVNDYDAWEGRSSGFSYGAIRAIVGMPLSLDNKFVGVFAIAHGREKDYIFTDDDVAILTRFADLAVLALQNARLFKKAQEEIKFRRKTEIELRNANQILQLQIEKVEMLQEQLQELAVRDPLTELYNRRYLQEALELEFTHPERSNLSTAILMMDSDHLKNINDVFGHKAGDDFLVYISEEIQRGIRAGDIACRYGGDEFVVVLSNVTENIALERAEKLRKTIAAHHIIHRNEKISVSVSIGIAMFPEHGKDGEILLQKADQALYNAKGMGKNRVYMYSEASK
jgi:diguanylate cyclase (GGDEF)-like protein/PAS domain S-box-containing protein